MLNTQQRADPFDLRIDTSIYPLDRFWVSYIISENADGEIERLWDNNTPSLQVGDTLTGEISIENRIGDSVYAPLVLNVIDFDLTGNENGVVDILCSYTVDTDQDGQIDLMGSRLVRDTLRTMMECLQVGSSFAWQDLTTERDIPLRRWSLKQCLFLNLQQLS